MNAKEIIKQAALPHALNFALGAIGPVLSSSRRKTPAGELLARSIGAGTGGMGGAHVGYKIGRTLAKKLRGLPGVKAKGRTGAALRAIAAATPVVTDLLAFALSAGAGSAAGKSLHSAAKQVMRRRWGKGGAEGLLKSVSVPTASAYELARSSM